MCIALIEQSHTTIALSPNRTKMMGRFPFDNPDGSALELSFRLPSQYGIANCLSCCTAAYAFRP